MPIPAVFCLCWAPLLISLSLAGCVVSTDYAGPAPEQVLPRLLAVLRDPDPEQRRTAAQSLGKIARKEAVPALLNACLDQDPGVRRQAAWALGMIGSRTATDYTSPLSELLLDTDAGVREAASLALQETGDGLAVDSILNQHDPPISPDSKRLALAALGGMAASDISIKSSYLVKFLQDPDARVRRWAVAALGEIADPVTVAPLSKALARDPDPRVRVEAAFRLGKFGGEAARPALAAALKDANADVRRLAEAALKELAGGGPS